MRIHSKSVQVILAAAILTFGMSLLGLSLTSYRGGIRKWFRDTAQANPRFQITSNSMAPRFLGPHYRTSCSQCLQDWIVAAETTAENSKAKCPVCGNLDCKLGPLLPGQNVSLHPLSGQPATGDIPRFSCIVFSSQDPQSEAIQWSCKRAWGLPGEQLELRDGELWIDGRMFQKSIDQLQSLAVSVANFPSDSGMHWKLKKQPIACPAEPSSLEELEHQPDQFLDRGISRGDVRQPTELRQPTEQSQPVEPLPARLSIRAGWELTWSYGARLLESTEEAKRLPVLDDYWCNDSTARNLQPVNDLLLTIEFDSLDKQPPGAETGDQLLVECVYQGRLGVVVCCLGSHDGPDPVSSLQIARNIGRLSIGGWDGRMWAQWDSEPAVPLPPSAAPTAENYGTDIGHRLTGFRLVGLLGEVSLSSLHVQRDLHLRYNERDPRNGIQAPVCLGADEYYVIGDNLPISRDSRNGMGSVHRGQIIGVLEP